MAEKKKTNEYLNKKKETSRAGGWKVFKKQVK